MPQVNLWAVLAAATSAFVAGGIWYAPALFGKAWQRAGRLSDEDLRGRNLPRVFGFAAGFAWVAASFGSNYLFERKPFELLLINGGYHTLQFTIYGAVLGLMP